MKPDSATKPEPTSVILENLRRRLREAGQARWEVIAIAAGAGKTVPRKVMYERDNPGIVTIQPLITFFEEVDAGKRQLPEPAAKVA